MTRLLYPELRPKGPIRAPLGKKRTCQTWDAEAALRMLMNNLDDRVAIDWEQLIVYAARDVPHAIGVNTIVLSRH